MTMYLPTLIGLGFLYRGGIMGMIVGLSLITMPNFSSIKRRLINGISLRFNDQRYYINLNQGPIPELNIQNSISKSEDSAQSSENLIRGEINSLEVVPLSTGDLDMTPKDNFSTRLDGYYLPSKHTILIGPVGSGKLSIMKHLLNYDCIVIGQYSDLKNFCHDKHRGIILRGLKPSGLTCDQFDLLTKREDRIIVVDNVEVLIPSQTEIVFVTNEMDGGIFLGLNRKFSDRFTFLGVNDKLY